VIVCRIFKPVLLDLVKLKCFLVRKTCDMMQNYKQAHNDSSNLYMKHLINYVFSVTVHRMSLNCSVIFTRRTH